MGVIETGWFGTGAVGTVAAGPEPTGLVGTVRETVGTTFGFDERSLIESLIDRIGAIPTGG
jgi:hypothetical protein